MRWIDDACGNADLEEVPFAEKGVSAILEYADLYYAPRDAPDTAMCLLGCLARELAEATVSHAQAGGRRACAVSPARRLSPKGRLAGLCFVKPA